MNEVTTQEAGLSTLSPQAVVQQVQLVQQVMSLVMHKGVHYGKIPGCGDKPTLLKPGAETLGVTFRLSPKYEIEETDLPGDHKEYRVICHMHHGPTGTFLGSGVGVATTMEGKWRYRTGPVEPTGKAVPNEYWNLRSTDPFKAKDLLGGDGFSTKKIDGKWQIVIQGEKVEHDNPADYYNTCLKMAKKRAHVDGILTATAASDCFTQDIEEDPVLFGGQPEKKPKGPSKASSVQPKKETPTREETDRKAALKKQADQLNQEAAHGEGKELSIKETFKKRLRMYCSGDMLKMQAVQKELTEFKGNSVNDVDEATEGRIKVANDKLNKKIEAEYPKGCALDPTACTLTAYEGETPYCSSTGDECPFNADF